VVIACRLEQAIGDVIVVLNPASDPPASPTFVEHPSETRGILVGVEADASSQPKMCRLADCLYFKMCQALVPGTQIYGATHIMALTRTALNAGLKVNDIFRSVRVFAMYVGFEVMGPSEFAFLAFVVGMKFFWKEGQHSGASTSFFNAFMCGCLFLVLAMVCEYLAEIRDDEKARPLYVVQDEFHSKTMMAGSERRNGVAHADDAQSIWSLEKPRTAA
jgi:hypothetical protein